MEEIQHKIALITGADGGIGSALVEDLISRGVSKLYAAALSADKLIPLSEKYAGIVIPVVLDITDEDAIKKSVEQCQDVTLLINNAGIELKSSFLQENAAQKALFEMRVNYIGVLNMINYFCLVLTQNAPSLIVNILSVGSSAVIKRLGTYCASKSAAHILTQTIREEMSEMGIRVIGVYPGYVNTEMSADVTHVEKPTPQSIAKHIFNGIEKGESDIFTDAMSRSYYEDHPISVTYLQ